MHRITFQCMPNWKFYLNNSKDLKMERFIKSRFAAWFVCFGCILGCNSIDDDGITEIDEEITSVEKLHVLNFNVRYFNPPSQPASVIDIEPVVEVINGIRPDVVALQEVDVNTRRSGNRNLARELADRLRMRYFFARAIDYQGGEYGLLILSRFPISESTVHRLPMDPQLGGEARILATVKVTLPDGREFRFGNTHLDAQSNPSSRILQAERIVEISQSESLPFILTGDFNAGIDSEEVQVLFSRFNNTCTACPPTFPAISPNRLIDYITYFDPLGQLSVASHQVVNESYASDHRPVFAVFNLAD